MILSHIPEKAFRKILRLVFKFDSWHTSILRERPYAMSIINYCNNRNERNSIAEIGCGLGDILRNVSYEKRLGFDMDNNVLRAASFLSRFELGNPVSFQFFQFPDSDLQGSFDVLIMVNWPFLFDTDTLRKYIEQYFNNNINNGGAIIIDTVGDEGYRYHHDIHNLTAYLSCKIVKLGDYERKREVWAIEKIS